MFLNNMTKIDMAIQMKGLSGIFNSNKLMFELTKFQDGSSHCVKKTKSRTSSHLFCSTWKSSRLFKGLVMVLSSCI